MDDSKRPPVFMIERDRTDHSFSSEREKTNQSLTDARNEVEFSTDEELQHARDFANEEQCSNRYSLKSFKIKKQRELEF